LTAGRATGLSASGYSHRPSRYPCAAADSRFLARASAFSASMMDSSGPERSICRMRECCAKARATLFKTVNPRWISCRVRCSADRACEVGAEPRIKKVVIVPHPKALRGEKVGKIPGASKRLAKAPRARIHSTPEASSSEVSASPRMQRARMLKDERQLCNTK
jgi:hypothetical protein